MKTKGSLSRFLFEPIDASSLVFFRFAFGALMLIEVFRYALSGWIDEEFIAPIFHFRYYGFDWVHPWPGIGMYLHFGVIGLAGIAIALGMYFRLASIVMFLGFTYIFLLDQAKYLNHFYMIALVSFLVACLPMHHFLSWDARRRSVPSSPTVPRWTVLLLQFQVGVVYFYGGIAKLNADWFQAQPLKLWLPSSAKEVPFLTFLNEEWAAWAFSYGGLIFDLVVVPLLIWRKTRLFAFILTLGFHLTNATIFNIGIFPPFMICATLIFFPPQWPRRLPYFSRLVDWWSSGANRQIDPHRPAGRRLVIAFLSFYAAFQLLVPLRHFLYPGNVSWTEEGHNFAWHMKLRDKRGRLTIYAHDPQTRRTWTLDPKRWLTPRQIRKMKGRPDMLVRFCHFAASELEDEHPGVEIRVRSLISLNGRRAQLLVDPEVDLSKVSLSLLPQDWILPLNESPDVTSRIRVSPRSIRKE